MEMNQGDLYPTLNDHRLMKKNSFFGKNCFGDKEPWLLQAGGM